MTTEEETKTLSASALIIPHTPIAGTVIALLIGVVFGVVPYVLLPWVWGVVTKQGVVL